MPKYLVWDFDGTLGYRDAPWAGALIDVLRQHAPDHPATIDLIRPHTYSGFPWHTPHQPYPVRTADQWWEALHPVFEQAYVAVGILPSDARRFAREVRAAYLATDRWHLFDDSLPILRQLSAQNWTHLLLSNHAPELPELLQYLGLDGVFSKVINSAETGFEKPHPQMFQHVLDVVGNAKPVWMIGDNPVADIAGAAAVGIPGILVRRHHPDAVRQCDTLLEVPAILASSGAP